MNKSKQDASGYIFTEIMVPYGGSAAYLKSLANGAGLGPDVVVFHDYSKWLYDKTEPHMTLTYAGKSCGIRELVNQVFPDEPDDNIMIALSVQHNGFKGWSGVLGTLDVISKLMRLSAKKLASGEHDDD